MKKTRKIVTIFMGLTLALGALNGCGKQEGNAGDTAADKRDEIPGSDIEIELVYSNITTLPDDNFIEEALAEAIGVKSVKMTMLGAGSDYTTALNAQISGGDVPDLFYTGDNNSLEQLVDEGLIVNLDNYKDKLAEVVEFVGEDRLAPHKYNGSWYILPFPKSKPYEMWEVRQDWLDTLGLEAPSSFEEFLEVAKAFTFDDPDGNGKQDTYGYGGEGIASFEPILNESGGSVMNKILIKDGEVTSSLLQVDAMKEGLGNAKALVDAGVVDPDVLTTDYTTIINKITQGTIGLSSFQFNLFHTASNIQLFKEVNPDCEWTYFSPWGKGMAEDIATGKGRYVLGSTLEETPEKLEKVFELINYLTTEEGQRLVNYGIEGRHYNIDNGVIVKTDLMSEECGFTWLYQLLGRNEQEYLKVKFPEASDAIDAVYSQKTLQFHGGAVDAPQGFYKEDMDRYIEENMVAFIFGQRDLGEYETFLQELEDTFQFKSVYIESAKQQIVDKGYMK